MSNARTSTPSATGSSHPTPSPSLANNIISYQGPPQQIGYLLRPLGDQLDPGLFPHSSVLVYSPTQSGCHIPYSFPIIPDHHGLSSKGPSAQATDRTSDWISEQQKIPYAPGSLASPSLDFADATETTSETTDNIWLLGNEQTLPQHQREAFYQSLCDGLPPACGFEESVGSYKAFMDQQAQGSYDRLAFGTSPYPPSEYPSFSFASTTRLVPGLSTPIPTPIPLTTSYPRTTHTGSLPPPPLASVQRTPVAGTNEFSNWLRFSGHSQVPNMTPPPSLTPSLSDTNTSASSLSWPPDIFGTPSRRPSDPSPISLDMSEILESPILRSRQPTSDVVQPITLPNDDSFKNALKDLLQDKGPSSPCASTTKKDENFVMVDATQKA